MADTMNFRLHITRLCSTLDAMVACGACLLLAVSSTTVLAAPQGGQIAAGSGTIQSLQNTTRIDQASQNMVVDWNSFNIAAGESVNFIQPSSTAAALNRINDQNPSQIFGNLNANGMVFLLNNNGFLFGETAQVQVGGLVTTNLSMDPGQFMSGIYELYSDANGNGVIINRGLISASTGGVSLISDSGVINQGKVYASYGNVNLATTTAATLDFDGDGLLRLAVNGEVLRNAQALESAVDNSGEIITDAGEVLLTGHASRDVFTNVVNNSGVIRATSIVNEGGVIKLVASGGDTFNSGSLDTSSAEGNGGQIQVLGDRVAIIGDANIDASGKTGGGEILIGGDYQGSNPDVHNATHTYVGRNATIKADAAEQGDGGKVIVWADESTRYYGDISVTGGALQGDGGFVEVSGKHFLDFAGLAKVSATNGKYGTLLLDPDNITVRQGAALSGADDDKFAGSTLLFGNGVGSDYVISEGTLEMLSGNIILQATFNIVVEDLANMGDGILDLSNSDSVVFQAGDSISFVTTNTIRTDGDPIHLEANSPDMTFDTTGTLTLGTVDSTQKSDPTMGADITLIGADFDFGSATITAGDGDINISKSHSTDTTIDLDAELAFDPGTGTFDMDYITTTGMLTIGSADSASATSVIVEQIRLSQALTVDATTAGSFNLHSTGTATTGLTIDDSIFLTVNQPVIVDADFDSVGNDGFIDVNGRIIAGANSISLHGNEISGDGDLGNEIDTTGMLTLNATAIGVSDSPLNITNVQTLIINDTGTGNVEIDVTGDTTRDIEVISNAMDISDLGSVTDFTYTNTHDNIAIVDIDAAGKNITINASDNTNGNITDNFGASGDITAANLKLSAEGDIGAANTMMGSNVIVNAIETNLSGTLTTDSKGSNGTFINEAGGITLDTINTGMMGVLEITTNGAITQINANPNPPGRIDGITVGGTASFDAGSAGIDLTDMDNDFKAVVNLKTTGNDVNVSIRDANQISLGTIDAGSANLSVNAQSLVGAVDTKVNTTVKGLSIALSGIGDIDVTNTGTLAINGIAYTGTGSGDISITTIGGDINGGSGAVSPTTTATLIADGGIGIGGAVEIDATNITLDTSVSTDSAGNISVVLSGAGTRNTSEIGTAAIDYTTDMMSEQTIDLSAASWNNDNAATFSNAATFGSDNITLRATAGNIIKVGGGSLTANNIGLFATATDANIGSDGTTISPMSLFAAGMITAEAANGTGGVYLNQTNAVPPPQVDLSLATIDAGTGDVELVINNGGLVSGDITGDSLLIIADGGINTDTDTNNLSVISNVTGDISVTNKGTVSIAGTGINNTSGAVSLITTMQGADIGHILNGGGDISSSSNVTLNANGGIGTDGTAVDVSAPNNPAPASITLTSNGDDAEGNIYIRTSGVNTRNTSSISFTTNGADTTTPQLVEILADNWNIDNTFGNSSDNLIIEATGANGLAGFNAGVAYNGVGTIEGDGTLVADFLGLRAMDFIRNVPVIAADSYIETDANNISVSISGTTTSFSSGLESFVPQLIPVRSAVFIRDVDSLNISTTLDSNANSITGISGVNHDINVIVNGDVNINNTMLTAGDISVQTLGVTADINGATGAIDTSGIITLNAGGSINNVMTVNSSFLFLTTAGIGSATDSDMTNSGDISVLHSGDLNTNNISITTKNDAVAPDLADNDQNVSLTANSWTIDSPLSVGTDNLTLKTTVGGITGSASLDTAGSITLDSATGIGADSTSLINLSASAVSLTSNGDNAAGNIFVDGGGSALDIFLDTNDSSQTVSVSAGSLNVVGDSLLDSDNLMLEATAGNITHNTNDRLAANSIGLIASGDIDVVTDAEAIAASAGSLAANTITIDSMHTGSDLSVGSVNVDGTTVNGLSASGDIDLMSADASISINQNIISAAGTITLTTNDSGNTGVYDIGGAGTVFSGSNITVNADGGIDGLNTDTRFIGIAMLTVTTNGADSAGNISITDSNPLDTSQVTISTDGSTQDILLSATEWTINSDLGNANDNLTLIATTGNIARTSGISGTLNAIDLSLMAVANNASIGANSPTGIIDANITGSLTASASVGSGGIFISDSDGDMSIGAAGINAGSGNVQLVSSGSISSVGTVIANDLSLLADSSNARIGTNSVAGLFDTNLTGELTASANSGNGGIFISDSSGSLAIAAAGVDAGSGSVQLISTGTIGSNGTVSASDLLLIGNGDITTATQVNNIAASAGSGDIALNNTGALSITSMTQAGGTVHNGITTTGNINLTSTGVLDASAAVISGNALSSTTSGGADFSNTENTVSSFAATNTGTGDITLNIKGNLTLQLIENVGNIAITTDQNGSGIGDITQVSTINSSAAGDISVTSTEGDLSMTDGFITTTNGGIIAYTANGDVRLSQLDAANDSAANVGMVVVNAGGVASNGANQNLASVRAQAVDITAFSIGTNAGAGAFVLSSDIQGEVNLLYTTNAFISVAPSINAELNINDLGNGLIDSSAARSAGNQRGESSGLEDVGFIDAALFSDINLFVVDGVGIGLPADQSDIPPGRFRPQQRDEEDKEKTGLDVSLNLH